MNSRANILHVIFMSLAIMLVALAGFECSGGSNPTESPSFSPRGTVAAQTDSIVYGRIMDIREKTTGYPWEVDVLIESSQNVDNLTNPTKDKLGEVVTVKADQDLSLYKNSQEIDARIKYAEDAGQPGASFYMYDIKTH